MLVMLLILVVTPPLVGRRRHGLRVRDVAEPDGLVDGLAAVFVVVNVRGLRVVRGLARHRRASAKLPRVEHFGLSV